MFDLLDIDSIIVCFIIGAVLELLDESKSKSNAILSIFSPTSANFFSKFPIFPFFFFSSFFFNNGVLNVFLIPPIFSFICLLKLLNSFLKLPVGVLSAIVCLAAFSFSFSSLSRGSDSSPKLSTSWFCDM